MSDLKYFSIDELCETNTGLSNEPDDKVIQNLTYLIVNVLDPVREKFGKPIYVNSGYRSKAVNKKIKGALNSQHMKGEAADITCGVKDGNKKIYDLIKANGKYDQLINEKDFSWIHVSYTKNINRKQELKM